MKNLYIICTFFLILFSAQLKSEVIINENFQSDLVGWNLINATQNKSGAGNSAIGGTNGTITLEKKSIGGIVETPTINDPTSITIITNNTGNTNRSFTLNYWDGEAWQFIDKKTVSLKAEKWEIDIIGVSGSTKLQIVNEGSNPFVISDIIIEGGSIPLNSDAEILSFTLPNQISEEIINSENATVNIELPLGSDLMLTPSLLVISDFATINPTGNIAQDFSKSVQYEVTAQDRTVKSWTVNVTLKASSENEILAFKLANNQIGSASINSSNGIISVKMPLDADISDIVPAKLTISLGATISPSATESRNFNSDVAYTVKAQDETEKTWTIKTQKVEDIASGINFNKVVGWADAYGGPAYSTTKPVSNVAISTTTGGMGGDTIYFTPSTFNDLCLVLYNRINYKNYSNSPLTIVLEEGIYDGSGVSGDAGKVFSNNMLTVQEQGDISILGKGNVQCKFGINIKRSYNIIIRNLYFWGYSDDAINVGEPETHHVWIDHCTAGAPSQAEVPSNKDAVDGTFEVKNGASYVTVSWSKTQNHWKSCLIGHSDSNGAVDTDRLKVTHFANYFYNTYSRHPRVRFGQVHVLNCMFYNSGWGLDDSYKTSHSIGLGYGTGASNNSEVVMENNFFQDVQFPFYADRSTADFQAVFGLSSSSTGNKPAKSLKQMGNAYDDSKLTRDLQATKGVLPTALNPGNRSIKFDELNPEIAFNPSDFYEYNAFNAQEIKDLVPQFAGSGILSWEDMKGSPTTSVASVKDKNADNFFVYSQNGKIHISGIYGISNVHVVDVAGRTVFNQSIEINSNTVIPAHFGKGVYVVRINNSSKKLVIR